MWTKTILFLFVMAGCLGAVTITLPITVTVNPTPTPAPTPAANAFIGLEKRVSPPITFHSNAWLIPVALILILLLKKYYNQRPNPAPVVHPTRIY